MKQEAGDGRGEQRAAPREPERDPAMCDICGIPALVWLKCKLVCENCGAINKTCADL